jgi:hypothetical protein
MLPTETAHVRTSAHDARAQMEQIRDLLNPARLGSAPRPGVKGGGSLRVREHPRTGPYVEDLAQVACSTSGQVQMLLAHGAQVGAIATALRVIAATQRRTLCWPPRQCRAQPVAGVSSSLSARACVDGVCVDGAWMNVRDS